jgi:hypothetical protein
VDQTDLLKLTITNLRQLNVRYAIVGSFASSIWGESRLTQDIDVVIDLKPGEVDALCNAFPEPEFYVSRPAANEAVSLAGQFNVIHPSSGNKIDFMVAARTDWALAQLNRSKVVSLFPDLPACVAAPDDVILGKLIYYREGGSEKHLRDIAGILKMSGTLIDRAYLDQSAKRLGVEDSLKAVLTSVGQS